MSGNPSRFTSFARWIAPVLAAVALGCATSIGHTAQFNERLSAPPTPGAAALTARIRAYFSTYERLARTQPGAIVRDRAAFDEWFAMRWALDRALDDRQPLGDLAEFGLVAQPNGSYSVDTQQFPQWAPFDQRLELLRDPQFRAAHVPELRARGFREADILKLEGYLARTASLDHTVIADKQALAASFTTNAQARQRAGLGRPDRARLLSYIHQRERYEVETRRLWSLGLLDSLDRQRGRILESYLRDELGGTLNIKASEDWQEQLRRFTDSVLSGRHAQELATLAEAVQ